MGYAEVILSNTSSRAAVRSGVGGKKFICDTTVIKSIH